MRIRRAIIMADTAATEVYTLSLHDALPISSPASLPTSRPTIAASDRSRSTSASRRGGRLSSVTDRLPRLRSEEHTSELQSHVNLVCRLLLENNNDALSITGSLPVRARVLCS